MRRPAKNFTNAKNRTLTAITAIEDLVFDAAAEFNVCRWLCCRSIAEERADVLQFVADHGGWPGWTDTIRCGTHVGAAAKGRR